jgi:hypothetical protein
MPRATARQMGDAMEHSVLPSARAHPILRLANTVSDLATSTSSLATFSLDSRGHGTYRKVSCLALGWRASIQTIGPGSVASAARGKSTCSQD